MKPNIIFDGAPSIGDVIKLDFLECGDTVFCYSAGTFSAKLVLLKNPETTPHESLTADYFDMQENGLLTLSDGYTQQPISSKGSYGLIFTAASGNVAVGLYK